MRKTLKRVAASIAAATMAMALVATALPTDVSASVSKAGKKASKADFDADGTYHAYFGFQERGTWIFRDEWYSDTLGIDGSSWADTDGLAFDSGSLFQSGTDGVTAVDGTVQDAEITGNGTYTVGVTGLNGALTSTDAQDVSMVYVDTDIPWSAKDNPVTISDVKLTVDGREVSLPDDVFYPSEYIDDAGLLRFDTVNYYQKDKGEFPDSPDIGLPTDSIQITFTVSGFNSDNPDAVEGASDDMSSSDDASAATATSEASTSSSSSSSPIVPIVIVVIVVVVVVVVVVKKKK
jgi:hypothetical protein